MEGASGQSRAPIPTFLVADVVEKMKENGVLDELKAKAVEQLQVNRSVERMERMAGRLVQRNDLVRTIYEEKKSLHKNPAAIFQSLHRDLTQRLHNDPGLAMFIDHSIDRVLVTGSSTNPNNTGIKHIIHKNIQQTVTTLIRNLSEPVNSNETNKVEENIVHWETEEKETHKNSQEDAILASAESKNPLLETKQFNEKSQLTNESKRKQNADTQTNNTNCVESQREEIKLDEEQATPLKDVNSSETNKDENGDEGEEEVISDNESDEERALQELFNEFGSSSDESEETTKEETDEESSESQEKLPSKTETKAEESESDSWSDSSDEILFQMDMDDEEDKELPEISTGQKRKLKGSSPPRKLQKTA